VIAYKRRLADLCAIAKKLSADRDVDTNGESRRAAIDALECLENAKIHIEAAIRAAEYVPSAYDRDDDADCVAEMKAEHDADVRRMNGDE